MYGHQNRNGALVERGIITAIVSAGFIVESLDRKDIISPPLSAIGGDYAAGDMVLFVLFSDGTGKIIAKT